MGQCPHVVSASHCTDWLCLLKLLNNYLTSKEALPRIFS